MLGVSFVVRLERLQVIRFASCQLLGHLSNQENELRSSLGRWQGPESNRVRWPRCAHIALR
jgi:hypothetical protein